MNLILSALPKYTFPELEFSSKPLNTIPALELSWKLSAISEYLRTFLKRVLQLIVCMIYK